MLLPDSETIEKAATTGVTPKGSVIYRGLRRLLGELGLTKIWEQGSSYYLWHAFPLKDPRLFQVVGVPRSGTTLLCSILASHSKVICLSEPYHQWKYDGIVFTEETSHIVGCEVWKKHPSLLFRQVLSKESEKIWIGFKEIYYSQSHGHWSNHFFFKRNHLRGLLTIAIIRDPREVWKSLILRHPEKKGKISEKFLESWNDLVQWILENRIFFIRYEDLITEPEKTIKKICEYMNIEFEKNMIYAINKRKGRGDKTALAGKTINKAKVHPEYDKYLSKNEILFIEDGCASLMKTMNYV